MSAREWSLPLALAITATLAGSATADTPASPTKVIESIDLSRAFSTLTPWTFVATQGPDVKMEISDPNDVLPGAISLCLSNDRGRTCRPDLRNALAPEREHSLYSAPHYLNTAQVVRPRGSRRAMLVLQFASLPSVDGDEAIGTRVFAYDRASDGFVEIYRNLTGRNNNQEVRYIAAGPLEGAIVAAVPTQDAPFRYWITVERLGPSAAYRPVLRYRSATGYADDNSLPVIDSEMVNIQQRLGLWRQGQPLALPAKGCAKPKLRKMELFCGQ